MNDSFIEALFTYNGYAQEFITVITHSTSNYFLLVVPNVDVLPSFQMLKRIHFCKDHNNKGDAVKPTPTLLKQAAIANSANISKPSEKAVTKRLQKIFSKKCSILSLWLKANIFFLTYSNCPHIATIIKPSYPAIGNLHKYASNMCSCKALISLINKTVVIINKCLHYDKASLKGKDDLKNISVDFFIIILVLAHFIFTFTFVTVLLFLSCFEVLF
uniref:Uncharacterized protein n=1 Tax=Glossina brevipalpis TaxID=37001 RepID=A0A1A9X074_9MUSC